MEWREREVMVDLQVALAADDELPTAHREIRRPRMGAVMSAPAFVGAFIYAAIAVEVDPGHESAIRT